MMEVFEKLACDFQPLTVFAKSSILDVLLVSECASAFFFQVDQLTETVRENDEIKDIYSHYFDITLCNEKLEDTVDQLIRHLNHLANNSQWVPISWVY